MCKDSLVVDLLQEGIPEDGLEDLVMTFQNFVNLGITANKDVVSLVKKLQQNADSKTDRTMSTCPEGHLVQCSLAPGSSSLQDVRATEGTNNSEMTGNGDGILKSVGVDAVDTPAKQDDTEIMGKPVELQQDVGYAEAEGKEKHHTNGFPLNAEAREFIPNRWFGNDHAVNPEECADDDELGTNWDAAKWDTFCKETAMESVTLDIDVAQNDDIYKSTIDAGLEYLNCQFPSYSREALQGLFLAHHLDIAATIQTLVRVNLDLGVQRVSGESDMFDCPENIDLGEEVFPALPGHQAGCVPAASGLQHKENFVDVVKKMRKQEDAGQIPKATRNVQKQGHSQQRWTSANRAREPEVPWVATGEVVSEQYAKAREEARNHARVRNACFMQVSNSQRICGRAGSFCQALHFVGCTLHQHDHFQQCVIIPGNSGILVW